MTATVSNTPSSARSVSLPRVLLHAEGLILFVASVWLYSQFAVTGWWVFGLFLLLPDAAMIFYLIDKRAGAIAYNAVHTYSIPVALGGVAFVMNVPVLFSAALIWFAHIAMDRAVGYGLKYSAAFKQTHLNRL